MNVTVEVPDHLLAKKDMLATNPTVVEIDEGGNKIVLDLDSRLFRDRIIFMAGVDEVSSILTVMKMLALEADDPGKPIHFYVSSYGGSVYDGLEVYDTMTGLTCPVWTYGLGKMMSMGSFLFMAGEPGHRYMQPNATLLMHDLSGGAPYQKNREIQADAAESNRLHKLLAKIYAHHTGQTVRTLLRDLDKPDLTFSAEEAVEYGFADGILTKTRDGVPVRGRTLSERSRPKQNSTRRTHVPARTRHVATPERERNSAAINRSGATPLPDVEDDAVTRLEPNAVSVTAEPAGPSGPTTGDGGPHGPLAA